jgi:hypothetical protein
VVLPVLGVGVSSLWPHAANAKAKDALTAINSGFMCILALLKKSE